MKLPFTAMSVLVLSVVLWGDFCGLVVVEVSLFPLFGYLYHLWPLLICVHDRFTY